MAVSNSPRGWVVVGVVLAALWTRTLALEVTSGSPCKSVCNGDYKGGFTFEGDLVCSDSQYNTTSEGNTMKSCLLCESTSTTYDNETENDLLWFLFNQKYTIQHCLFQESDQTLCEDQCGPLRSMLSKSWYPDKKDPKSPLYDYCKWNNNAFEKYWEGCAACVRGQEGSFVLGNFLENIGIACKSKPDPADGETLELKNPLFATSLESETATTSSSPTETSSSGSSGNSESEGSSESDSQSPETPSNLSTRAKVSIGVGVGVGVLSGVIALILVIWFFIRRNRRKQRQEIAQPVQYPHGYYKDPNFGDQQSPYPQPAVMSEAGGVSRSELPG